MKLILYQARATVMGGQQVCYQACRLCNGGGMTVTAQQEIFSFLREKSILTRKLSGKRRRRGLQTSVLSRRRRRRKREKEHHRGSLSPCRWTGPGLMLHDPGAEQRLMLCTDTFCQVPYSVEEGGGRATAPVYL